MTKAELVEKMAEDADTSKAAANKALDSFVDSVKTALKKKNGKIALVGFGTFLKVRRKARKGRNPATGEEIKIKARNAVTFRPGKALKDSIDFHILNFTRPEEGGCIVIRRRPITR